MRLRRRQVTPAERDAAAQSVCQQLFAREDVRAALKSAAPIAVYVASAEELDLAPFIRAALSKGAALVAPRWNGETYELVSLDSLESLIEGPHHILEPRAGDVVEPPSVAVWLVPGLAFTRQGGRLGYGGGWYDRFLSAASPTASKLGIAYPFQLVDELPLEAHDVPLTGFVGSVEPRP